MNNADNEKKARQVEMARKVWLVLTPLFAVLVLFMLYNWSRGNGSLTSIFSPLALMFIGLSTLVAAKSKALQYVFLAAGMILVVTGLILLFVY